MEGTDFFLVDTDSQKLKADQKFIVWVSSKMSVVSQVMGLENYCILRMNIWIKLII